MKFSPGVASCWGSCARHKGVRRLRVASQPRRTPLRCRPAGVEERRKANAVTGCGATLPAGHGTRLRLRAVGAAVVVPGIRGYGAYAPRPSRTGHGRAVFGSGGYGGCGGPKGGRSPALGPLPSPEAAQITTKREPPRPQGNQPPAGSLAFRWNSQPHSGPLAGGGPNARQKPNRRARRATSPRSRQPFTQCLSRSAPPAFRRNSQPRSGPLARVLPFFCDSCRSPHKNAAENKSLLRFGAKTQKAGGLALPLRGKNAVTAGNYTQPVGLGRPAILQAPLPGPEGKSSYTSFSL